MGPILVFLFLWVMLEIYIFVVLGNALGYLFTIFLIFAFSYFGVMITRKFVQRDFRQFQMIVELMTANQRGGFDSAEYDELVSKLQNMSAEQREEFVQQKKRNLIVDQLAMFLFILPGFISDVIGCLILLVNMHGRLARGGLFNNSLFEKMSSFGRNRQYREYMNQDYGKSNYEKAREAEQARSEQDVPVYNPEKSSVEEMKARFKAEKVIKDARYEEIDDDHDSPDGAKK